MTIMSIDTKRQVIPRWLDYKIACSLGLLKTSSLNNFQALDLEKHYHTMHKWSSAQNSTTALDLIAEALILGEFESFEAKAAANYVLANSSYPLQRELADYFLNHGNFMFQESLSFTMPDIRKGISDLRHSVRNYPINALAWSELSLCYAGSGNINKSKRAASVSLALNPTNRFILRNAAHCYLHFDDPDRAVYILRKSGLGNVDPWIASAEIAISEISGLKSKCIKPSRDIVNNDNLTAFSRSELAAQLGTVEYKNASTTKARRLMKLALEEPNENSLAQVQWFAKDARKEIIPTRIDVAAPFEAESWRYYFLNKFPLSFQAAKHWAVFQPLSSDPVIQASYLASTFMNNNMDAIQMIEGALLTLRHNPIIKNNYAVCLLGIGKIYEAESELRGIELASLSPSQKLVHTATLGMLAYRKDDKVLGESLYRDAIYGFEKLGAQEYAAVAMYFWAREEERIGSPTAESKAREARLMIEKYGPFVFKGLVDKLLKHNNSS